MHHCMRIQCVTSKHKFALGFSPGAVFFTMKCTHTHITYTFGCLSFRSVDECISSFSQYVWTLMYAYRGGGNCYFCVATTRNTKKKKNSHSSQPNASTRHRFRLYARCSNNLRLCVAMRKLNILLLGHFFVGIVVFFAQINPKNMLQTTILLPESCRIFIYTMI